MTLACTQNLLAALPNAPSQICVTSPSDVGLAAKGHVGTFRRTAAVALWPMPEARVVG